MKKWLLLILFICLLPTFVSAKYISCDPQAGVIQYKVSIPTQGIIDEISISQPDGSCLHNIDAWPSGTYTGTIQAGSEHILNGVPQGVMEWSVPFPFDLTKPSVNIPLNIGLEE